MTKAFLNVYFYLAFLLLISLDGITTYFLLFTYGGQELNPVWGPLIHEHGLIAIIGVKTFAAVALLGCFYLLDRRYHWLAWTLTFFICSLPIIWNTAQIMELS